MAILEYLEETHPQPALLPSDSLGRARVRQMSEVINSGIQPVQNLRVMQKLQKDFSLEKSQAMQWSADWIRFGFDALEKLAAQHSGQYCYADSVSFADACLVPQLFNGRKISWNSNGFYKLGYDLCFRIHNPLSQANGIAVQKPSSLLLGHKSVF